MTRLAFSLLLAIHGIIHLMGFAKVWDLGPNGRFSGKTLFKLSETGARFVGILWFIACSLLLISTISYYMQQAWFWIPASAGLMLSQGLIIQYWRDAKWGTLVNLIILIVIAFSVSTLRFKTSAKEEINNLVNSASTSERAITEKMISELPPVVQTWLRNSHIVPVFSWDICPSPLLKARTIPLTAPAATPVKALKKPLPVVINAAFDLKNGVSSKAKT